MLSWSAVFRPTTGSKSAKVGSLKRRRRPQRCKLQTIDHCRDINPPGASTENETLKVNPDPLMTSSALPEQSIEFDLHFQEADVACLAPQRSVRAQVTSHG